MSSMVELKWREMEVITVGPQTPWLSLNGPKEKVRRMFLFKLLGSQIIVDLSKCIKDISNIVHIMHKFPEKTFT